MTWVTVKDFDQDVKVGDRIGLPSEDGKMAECVFLAAGESIILMKCNGLELPGAKDDRWQVWREPVRWIPQHLDPYYTVLPDGSVFPTWWEPGPTLIDMDRFKAGNVWRTKEQAQEYADECKKVAERLHEKFGG